MHRRGLILGIGGTLAALPFTARAQKAMPVIGWLSSGSADAQAVLVDAFRRGLAEAGYVEGHNCAIEYRWAEGGYDRLPALALDLVRRRVTVIVAVPYPVAVAVKAASVTIPIVFFSGFDPVEGGLVTSFSRPEGNVTGVAPFTLELGKKRWGLLHELVSDALVFGLLVNPKNPNAERQANDAREAARATGMQLILVNAGSETELDAAFVSLIEQRAGGVIVGIDPFFSERREQFVAAAARHAVPTIYWDRQFAVSGGLISYGTRLDEAMRQVGLYTGKILAGAKPADLPVIQPTRFELVINLKTAKALGLTVPPILLAQANEVIE